MEGGFIEISDGAMDGVDGSFYAGPRDVKCITPPKDLAEDFLREFKPRVFGPGTSPNW